MASATIDGLIGRSSKICHPERSRGTCSLRRCRMQRMSDGRITARLSSRRPQRRIRILARDIGKPSDRMYVRCGTRANSVSEPRENLSSDETGSPATNILPILIARPNLTSGPAYF